MPAAYDRLPLGSLRVFEAVATALNFSAAAEALNVSPAAVSQQIKTLEEYLQVPLFRRTGRRVELTDEALELLPAVRDGLERLECALFQIKQHRRAGPLQISLLASFLQMWLLPRVRSFRRKFSDVELRFHTSRDLIDFSRTSMHVAIRFGNGSYAGLHSEKLLDDWLVPVASPELVKQHGMIERGADLRKYPLLESDDEPWSVWRKPDEEAAWHSRAPSIDDSAGLLAAAGWRPEQVWNGGYPFHDWSKKIANRNPDRMLARFGRAGEAVSRQVRSAGFTSMLIVRLIPGPPFAVWNYGAGVAGVGFGDYFFATLLGTFPAHLVFVYSADALFNGTMTEADALKRLAIVGLLLIGMVGMTSLLKRRFAPKPAVADNAQ